MHKQASEELEQFKIKLALINLRLRRWTVWKAAGFCGESYRSMLELMRMENVPFPLSIEDLELEIVEKK
jgi:hypothetical protein